MKTRWWLLLGVPLVGLSFVIPIRTITAQTAVQFGDPLPGLPDPALASFQSGREKFVAEETPATGLGPVYNAKSCAECHGSPAAGGSAVSLENRTIRFARRVEDQPFDPLLSLGGPNLQRFGISVPGCSLVGEPVPPEANLIGLRQPPHLFGLGLVQAIPDSAILANADPTDANGDGIAGRPNMNGGVIGRFGWKASGPTILHFVGLALVNELGITNYLFPDEMSPRGGPIPPGCKITADPEDADASRLSGLLFFTTFLAPPPRGPITEAVLRGEGVFQQIGCALCHIPSMKTGPNAVAALHEKDVPLYSDLLTHYMGGALDDGIIEGLAGGGRWRTAPLWGLRVRNFFLHDGRAFDLLTAIGLHGGEASRVSGSFLLLPQAQRDDLVAFLRSL